MAASDSLVEEADAAQYELGEGPCLDAMAGRIPMVVVDMRTEQRWPQFATRTVGLGLLSQMGMEIFREGGTVGGLDLYSTRVGAFDDTTQHAASLFAVHAVIAMDKSMAVTDLSQALQTRQTIGQAVGITMQRYTINEHLAFRYLVRVSQDSSVPLHDVAQTPRRPIRHLARRLTAPRCAHRTMNTMRAPHDGRLGDSQATGLQLSVHRCGS